MSTSGPKLPASVSNRFPPTSANLPFEFGEDYLAEQPATIDLASIWSAAFRNRYLILAVVALSLLAGVASIMLTQPTYRALAGVEIEQRSARILGNEDVEPAIAGQEMDRFLQTHVDILKSRGLAARVADSLKLARNDNFLVAVGEQPIEGQTPQQRRNRVIGALQAGLEVELPQSSRIVGINFDSLQPAVSAAVANSYAENLIASNLQRRFDMSAYSREFLQKQLSVTKINLEQSERALLSYARSAGLLDASNSAEEPGQPAPPRSLVTANLVQINSAYSAARAARVQAQQRWRQAQSTPLMNLPEVLMNPAISGLSEKKADLQALYQQQLQRRKADHPEVIQAGAQLQELDQQINTIANSILGSIRDQYLVAQQQESALQGTVSQLKSQSLSEQDRGVRYNILKREVETNRGLFDALLQRHRELSATAGVSSNNISIVDRADPPTSPISPRPAMNMALAAAAGLILALFVVFAREMFDDAVRKPEDLDWKLGLPLLGTVPKISRRSSAMEELLSPRSELAEAYHAIRAAIELSSGEGAPKSILVTSSRESEGKSTSAFALALDFASSGAKVLLIDADMRKPSLHTMLSYSNHCGLSSLLSQQAEFEEAIQETDLKGLHFLSAGPPPPNPAMLLSRNHLATLLMSLRSRYDQIVIDSPPTLGLADAPRLAALAEGTVFIIEAERAHHGQAKMALRRLNAARPNMIGAVLTKFDPGRLGLGHYYESSYHSPAHLPEPDEREREDAAAA
jgi:capsular exopolysaccharide synthesis family protein